VRRTTGKKTMQIESVAASAGVAICWALSRTTRVSEWGVPSGQRFPWFRWMFSTSTVASSTSMPIASARPPRVMRFRVWPAR